MGSGALGSAGVFQFTPLREGRLEYSATLGGDVNFNSRPSARGDTDAYPWRVIPYISIHAPPRGATIGNGGIMCTIQHFNSRPSARGDIAESMKIKRLKDFNSRPSARGDPRVIRRRGRRKYFNSRPSARGDNNLLLNVVTVGNFNSRPSARGDAAVGRMCGFRDLFQFTPLREGRRAR